MLNPGKKKSSRARGGAPPPAPMPSNGDVGEQEGVWEVVVPLKEAMVYSRRSVFKKNTMLNEMIIEQVRMS